MTPKEALDWLCSMERVRMEERAILLSAKFRAAVAEEREAGLARVRGLMAACDELMTEFVSKKRAADWSVINEGMLAGEKAIRARGQSTGGQAETKGASE